MSVLIDKKDIQQKYNVFLRKNIDMMMKSIMDKETYDRTYVNDRDPKTKYVKLQYVVNIFPVVKIKIIPIGLYLRCHDNTQFMKNMYEGLEIRKGFLITACKCGRQVNYEFHSVNYDVENEIYYDITKDFLNEEEVLFLDLGFDLPVGIMVSLFFNGAKLIRTGMNLCRCNNPKKSEGYGRMNASRKDMERMLREILKHPLRLEPPKFTVVNL